MKAEWRCVAMALGAQCVMTSGIIVMPAWCVVSLATPEKVHAHENAPK